MDTSRLVIFTAVMLEAKAVARALEVACPVPGRATAGGRGGTEFELHVIGIGGRGLPNVQVNATPNLVVMAGLAGGLDPRLQIGDVVVDGLPEGALGSDGFRYGRIETTARIAATPQEKATLFARTGALAVEMENEPVRQWAGRAGARFVAIRAISDRADQSLDPAVLSMIDPWGRPRPAAIAAALVRRPSLIGTLARLGRDSNKAASNLGAAVIKLVDRLPSI